MKNILLTALLGAFMAFSGIAQEIIPGQVLVKITDSGNINDVIKELNESIGVDAEIRVKRELSDRMNIWLLAHRPSIDEQTVVDKLYNVPTVIDAQLNHVVQLRETVPNDTDYDQQWQHQNVQSELAWDITTGGMTGVGDEIVVCVIEGGNAEHVDLQDNCWRNENEIPDNGIDDDNNGYVDDYDGWNVASASDDGVFNGGHGTSVMGMIGAKGNNDLGVAGANWDVKIMSVAGENVGNEASLVEAYGYPLDMRMLYEETSGAQGAFVVATNASWGIDGGNPENSPIWCGIYETMGEGGILNCGATANNNVDIDAVGDLPTACASDYMISVTATNNNDVRTFSGYGATTIDLGAPGDNIYTTNGSNGYGFTSGTSFASPMTAGIIGLLYSAPCTGLGVLAHEDPQAAADLVRQVLFDGVDVVDNLVGECVTGGRVNSFNSLQLLLAVCSEDACFAPFSTTLETEDNVSFVVGWSSFNEENIYDFRYRAVGDPDWIEALGLEGSEYDMGVLEWCTEYEYEIKTTCGDIEAEWAQYPTITTDGCCVAPAPELISVEAIDEESINIEWSSVLAAESYSITYNIVGEDPSNISDITETSYVIEGLVGCTDYEITVSSLCSDDVANSNQVFEITTFGCGHCTDSEFCLTETETTADEWIDSFSVADYDNNSGDDGGYGDYTGSDITLNRGNTFPVNVEAGYSGQPFAESIVVWIDLDQDGEFEDDEVLANDPDTDSGLSDNITIPMDALLGLTRLRVSLIWSNDVQNIQDPCGNYEYGETEDYCVVIDEFDSVIENAESDFDIYPNPATDIIIIELQDYVSNGTIVLMDLTGKVVATQPINSKSSQLDVANLSSGAYFVEINQGTNVLGRKQLIKQ